MRTTVFGLIISLMLALMSSQAQIAGPIVNPANGHYYYLLDYNTWTASYQKAVALGGHLVTINDEAENEWVLGTFSNPGRSSRNLWLGLQDLFGDGEFQWGSREPVTYTNWQPGQPGNEFPEETVVFMYGLEWPDPGKWADSGPSYLRQACGVVEIIPPTITIQSGVNINWTSRPNIRYQVQFTTNTPTNSWSNLGSPVTATNTLSSVFDPLGNSSKRSYRVVQLRETL